LDARQQLMLILITESIFKAAQTNKTFSVKILSVFSSAACFCVQPVAEHMQNFLIKNYLPTFSTLQNFLTKKKFASEKK
jgi:hypothetical protein